MAIISSSYILAVLTISQTILVLRTQFFGVGNTRNSLDKSYLSLNPSFLVGKIEWVYSWSEMRDEKDLTPPTTLCKQMKQLLYPFHSLPVRWAN